LASSPLLESIVEAALGAPGFAVRGILFNKLDGANWNVAWHQDCMIPVRAQIDLPDFGPWTWKAGVLHVEPPAFVLERMITLRIHLDDCGDDNGPLRVIAGSHRNGKLAAAEVAELTANKRERVCAVSRGGIVAMHPLLLHASSKAAQPAQRRVVHLEYAVDSLPGGLQWHTFQDDAPSHCPSALQPKS